MSGELTEGEKVAGFWRGKRVVVGISGGIAAYQTLALLRQLREEGAELPAVVVTAAALQFVTRLSLQALSQSPVYDALFDLIEEREMGHIRLAREADLVVVAPVTADLMAKMAQGHADDLLTTLLLARRGPVLLAPAMNAAMWEHPATRRNVRQLEADGLRVVGPEYGELACGEVGMGRMAPVARIVEEARRCLIPRDLAGSHWLVTAGPTREALDRVRYLTNHSSGRMGWAVALALVRRGARVSLVHGPVELPVPDGVEAHAVTSAREMQAVCMRLWPSCQAVVMTAAVADYAPEDYLEGKIKKSSQGGRWMLSLTENPDILAGLLATRRPDQVVVGFAAEAGAEAVLGATTKLVRKGCDLLVVNDLLEAGSGFGGATNRVTLLAPGEDAEPWPLLTKETVGARLVERMVGMLARRGGETRRC